MARGFAIPGLPGGSGQMATVMLLIIGIVGTTVAPWQLFFQQSYVVDKRITPRFIRYEKVDLWIGIVIVVVGAAALMGATAAAFAGTAGRGPLHRRRRAGPRHRGPRGPGRGRGVRGRAARRLHHRRVRGLAVHRVRGRRHARPQALAAPRVPPGQGLLRDLRRADRGGRGHRAHPRRPARPDHRGRPGAGGRAAAVRHGVPAAAVQRPRGPRALGQPPRHQRVHLGRGQRC